MAEYACPKLAELEGAIIAIATGDTTLADGDAIAAALAHAESCPACAAELAAYRKLHARLTPPRLPDDAAARIAARVRETAHARLRAWERRRRLLRVAAAVSGIAAVALLAIALWPHKSADGPAPNTVVVERPRPARPAPASASRAGRPSRIVHQSVPAPITSEQQKLLDEAARLREVGRRHVRAHHHDQAEKPLRQAVALMDGLLAQSSDGDAALAAVYEKYRCHQLLGEYLARESCLRSYVHRVRERDGKEAAGRALLEDARRLIRERDLETAGRRLERALGLCPTGRVAVAAHLTMASAAERQGLHDLAYSQYGMALAQGPPPALAARMYRAMISTSTRNRNFDLALEHAEKLCALPAQGVPPRDRVLHYWLLARLYVEKGRTAEAVRGLREVIAEYGPQHTELARLELERIAERAVGLGVEGHE